MFKCLQITCAEYYELRYSPYGLKKLHLVKVAAFSWYSVKIRVIFGVRFERRKVHKKANLHQKGNIQTLFYRVFWIFQPNVIKIDLCNFEPYRFKVCARFLETQCRTLLRLLQNYSDTCALCTVQRNVQFFSQVV